ncbi:MAG: hypothetical protein H6673_14385 [Anaerolineales bacterium]|nr:hypothetical protein [Anaerolineales bacterium]
MDTISLSQSLHLIAWFCIAFLIFILALIARFYESSSGEKTRYQFYAIPVLTLGFASARYASLNRWGGDWVGDGLSFIGGATLLGLCLFLYRQMTKQGHH